MAKWKLWIDTGNQRDEWYDRIIEAESEEEAMKKAEAHLHKYIGFGAMPYNEDEDDEENCDDPTAVTMVVNRITKEEFEDPYTGEWIGDYKDE